MDIRERIVATHPAPVWAAKADCLGVVPIVVGDQHQLEALALRMVEPSVCRVCCIPFLAYGISLDDAVMVVPVQVLQGLTVAYEISRVCTPSGRAVARVNFAEGSTAADRRTLADEFAALGALMEWSSPRYLALDLANSDVKSRVADALVRAMNAGMLTFERAD